MPPPLRLDHLTGRVLWRRDRLSRDQVEREDPTEAVRSEEVLSLARRFFRTEMDCPYGGGLLNPLLFGVITNFRAGHPEDDHLLTTLCEAEDRLFRSGAIASDFAIYVGGRMP